MYFRICFIISDFSFRKVTANPQMGKGRMMEIK